MGDSTDDTVELLRLAGTGDVRALAEVLERNRERLKQMVRVRLDPRLRGRLDPSDVIQEAYLDAARRLPEYVRDPAVPFFLWLRKLTAQRLIDLHRQHLGAKMRDASLEVSLHSGAYPQASSLSLAAQLLGRFSSPSRAAMRAEVQIRVQEALNTMDTIDREILALRHFEMLTNDEVAQVLEIKKTAASNRYVRALKRSGRRNLAKAAQCESRPNNECGAVYYPASRHIFRIVLSRARLLALVMRWIYDGETNQNRR